ncbi:HDOD domain-containing protein [Aquibacillus halophilus]|uniref:HDOD domain-containing protein n=1 Tax=Aquibacillus halophilus TaxID=930132 RepID=A0A6A8DEB5_9BACI|nr:HDOD domain-containing protein [Aquibacillus halophilus]MRH43904.1 HDOD domain-containing protein [Aquibacillus halophilus]
MEVFVAKQPIFNNNNECIAYELLYRNSLANFFNHTDGDKATTEVIVNSFLNIGIKKLSNGKPCFVNFTEKLLELKVPTYFTPHSIVIEILENVEITQQTVNLCKDFKSLGYTIALDDFFLMHENENVFSLLHYVDIIKIDFLATSKQERNEIKDHLKSYNLAFLAEKVETQEEYEEAIEDGYVLFQGYFFSEPIILQTNDIPPYFFPFMLILKELDKPEPDINRISSAIESDLSITYKLLKLINSPIIRTKYEIGSIKQAVVLLGLKEIKKWLYVLALRGTHKSKSSSANIEVIHLSLTRAKLSELIGEEQPTQQDKSKYFLLGMLSLIDTVLHLPMKKVLDELPISNDVKEALLGQDNDLRKHLDFIKIVERLNFDDDIVMEHSLSISKDRLFTLYSRANIWADNLLKEAVEVEIK